MYCFSLTKQHMLRDKRKDVERAYQRQRLELLQQAQQTLDDHQKVSNDES